MRIPLLYPTLTLLLAACAEDDFYRHANYNPDDPANAPKIEEFAAPGGNARLQTWWHWINGNVSKEGIRRDLDEMADKGYGTAVIFSLEGSLEGPVRFGSPAWYDAFAYAAEVAAANGMEIGAHNCDGWNEAGGPWNTPENSMKALTWSFAEATGDGSGQCITLPKPDSKMDFYRDIAVLAWPSREVPEGTIARYREKSAQLRSWMEEFPEDDRPIPSEALIGPDEVLVFRDPLPDDGIFTWEVPAGTWKIMRLGYTTTGKVNGPGTKEGTGLEVDKMNAAALDHHFASYAGKLAKAAGEYTGKSFTILSTDSWECEHQNWTEGFDARFAELNGYDFLPWIPVFTGQPVGSREATENFLKDFRHTTSYLINRNFYARFAELSHQTGLRYETEPSWDSYVMNQASTFRYADIPQDEIWAQPRDINRIRTLTAENPVWPNEPLSAVFPTAPSAAHFYGKELVSCEALTSWTGNWADCPADMKETCNRIQLSGYNTLVFHTYVHQPDERRPGWQMEPFGSAINRKLTWWPLSKPFFTYLTRIQYMLQKGRPDARILALYADKIPAGKVRQEFPDAVIADVITGESVRDWLRCEKGCLVSPGRMRYDLLAVSPDIFLRLETLRALKKRVEEGASISGYRLQRYGTNAGGAEARAEWDRLNDELFGSTEKSVRRIGKGCVYANYSAREAAAAMGIAPAITFDTDENIQWTKRVHADGSAWYWLINGTDKPLSFSASFDTQGTPVFWNAEDGTAIPAAVYRNEGERTTVPITIAPYADIFVMFTPQKQTTRPHIVTYESTLAPTTFAGPAPTPFRMTDGNGPEAEFFAPGSIEATLSDSSVRTARVTDVPAPTKLSGPFTVEFDERWGAPARVRFDDFESWTENPDPGIRNYSGLATYKIPFTIPDNLPAEGRRAYLQFTKLGEVGEITLNGRPAGSLWKPPYTLEITDLLLPGDNELQIRVANTWANRCLYDATLPESERLTWSNTMRFLYPEPGKEIHAHLVWRQGPIPSGVIGPVRIVWSQSVPLK